MAIKSVTDSSIENILKDKFYKIPMYQREYSWGAKERDELFSDIIENDKDYFIGTFITLSNGECIEIIDGQQRITTISILMITLYEILTPLRDEFAHDDEFLEKLLGLKKKVIRKDNNDNDVLVLQLQTENGNNEDYDFLLKSAFTEKSLLSQPSRYGNRRIAQAKIDFESKINDVFFNDVTEMYDLSLLFKFVDKINTLQAVVIDAENYSDANKLFEAINNRGLALTSIDLIKNILLGNSDEKEINIIYKKWGNIIENLGGENVQAQRQFLQHHFSAFSNELYSEISELPVILRKSNLIPVYEKIIKNIESLTLWVNRLEEDSKLYHQIINNEFNFVQLKQIDMLQGGFYPIILLEIYKNKLDILSPGDVIKILDELVKFYVYKTATGLPASNKHEQLFTDLANKIYLSTSKKEVFEHLDKILLQPLSNETFISNIKSINYRDKKALTNFMLRKLEEYNHEQTKEIQLVDIWKQEFDGWQIEHIFPQKPNVSEWLDYEELELEVHNLTLTRYNSKLYNSKFETKLNATDENGNAIGYKNGLWLNNELVLKDNWSIKDVIERNKILTNEIQKIYTFS